MLETDDPSAVQLVTVEDCGWRDMLWELLGLVLWAAFCALLTTLMLLPLLAFLIK